MSGPDFVDNMCYAWGLCAQRCRLGGAVGTHFGSTIGVRTKVYVSNDVVGSDWSGDGKYKLQQDVSVMPLEDGEIDGQEANDCVVGEYTWLRDPMLGRRGVRKYAIRGWEDKAEYDGKALGSWEGRERALTTVLCKMIVDNGGSGSSVPSIAVRNGPIGDHQRAYLLYSTSDAVVTRIERLAAELKVLSLDLMSVDGYKAFQFSATSTRTLGLK